MMRIAIKLLSVTACFCASLVLMTACGSEPTSDEPVQEPAEEAVTYDLTIGAEADDVVTLPIKNDTTQAITSFEVKSTDVTDFPASMLKAGETWAANATAEVYFAGVALAADEVAPVEDGEAAIDEGAAESASSEADEGALNDVVLNPLYDIRFTLEDGKSYVLHQMNLSGLMGAEDIALNVDSTQDVGYMTYKADGSDVSTLGAEEQIKAQIEAAEAQAQAEAEAARQAEEAARQAAAANSASATRSTSGGYDSVGGSGGSSGGSAPSQSEDSCIDAGDLILD